MKIGLALLVAPRAMIDLGVTADRYGFESVWLPDHLMIPASEDRLGITNEGSDTRDDPAEPHGSSVSGRLGWVDPLVMIAALSQRAHTVMLGTWIYNLALRHPLVVARSLAAIDLLAPGRMIFGAAAGWVREEYDAVGVHFEDRGRVVDESLDVLEGLWRQEVFGWDGASFTIPPVEFNPKPSQGRVPVFVGGESPRALRRAAERSDGWAGGWHTVETAKAVITMLREACRNAQRDFDSLEITLAARPKDMAEIHAYEALGVDRLIITPWESPRRAKEGVERFAQSDMGRRLLDQAE